MSTRIKCSNFNIVLKIIILGQKFLGSVSLHTVKRYIFLQAQILRGLCQMFLIKVQSIPIDEE